MIKINDKHYRELRCQECRKFAIYEYVVAGRMAFVCPRCGHTSEWVFKMLGNKNDDKILEQYKVVKRKES
jgi:phage FluMu protein Com